MMKSIRCLGLGLLLLSASRLLGFNLQEFIHETQRLEQTPGGVTLVWWIPTVYWEATLKQSPNVNAKQIADIVAAVEPYSLFAVVKMEVGTLGTVKTMPRGDILEALDIKFDGKTLDFAQEREISPEVKNLMAIMKPVMASMLGQMGQGLEFVVFPNTRIGKKIIDPLREGTIEAKLLNATMRWRLPLGVLLPRKTDPKSGESFPGNYNFNPFSGTALKARPDSASSK